MLARQKTILHAAYLVFCRYGYKRATMNDIAAEAGVARQTLYNAFSNKETILRAIIRQMTDETIADLEALAESDGALEDAIEILFDHTARKPYETIKASPHADELIEGINGAAAEELQLGCERKITATDRVFSNYVLANGVGLTTQQLAKLIITSALLFPKQAQSKEELEALLGPLKALVLNAFSHPKRSN